MIVFKREDPIEICGRTITVISRTMVKENHYKKAMFFAGDKRPVAIILHDQESEIVLDIMGKRLDESDLQAMMAPVNSTGA